MLNDLNGFYICILQDMISVADIMRPVDTPSRNDVSLRETMFGCVLQDHHVNLRLAMFGG